MIESSPHPSLSHRADQWVEHMDGVRLVSWFRQVGVVEPRHQVASGVVYDLLRRACPPDHQVLYAPVDLDLPGGQRVEPDLVVVPRSSIGEQRLSLPVLLVVELVSPSTAVWDTVAKRAAYAEAGIEHYWLVDTRTGQERFTALSLPSGAGEYEVVAESDEEIDVHDPVTVSVPLTALFEPPR
jgi:Uma2 family endonuclease